VTPNFGTFGVDIFFIISGFVMALIISSGQSPLAFAISRIARIVPLYWTLTSALLLLILTKPSLVSKSLAESASTVTYLKSLFFIPYFGAEGCGLKPLVCVGWTLNYEMFFYSIIFLSISLFRSHSLKVASLFLTLAYAVGISTEHEVARSFLSNEIILEFIFGFVVFFIYRTQRFETLSPILLITIVVASYCFLAYTEASGTMMTNRLFSFGIPAFLLTTAFILLEKTLPKNNGVIRLCESLGDASYATYLTHWWVIVAIRKIMGEKFDLIDPYSATGALLATLVALVVGHITYSVVDRPLSRKVRSQLATLFRR